MKSDEEMEGWMLVHHLAMVFYCWIKKLLQKKAFKPLFTMGFIVTKCLKHYLKGIDLEIPKQMATLIKKLDMHFT